MARLTFRFRTGRVLRVEACEGDGKEFTASVEQQGLGEVCAALAANGSCVPPHVRWCTHCGDRVPVGEIVDDPSGGSLPPSSTSLAASGPKQRAASKRSHPRSTPAAPVPAHSQSTTARSVSPSQRALPCQRSPWTSPSTDTGRYAVNSLSARLSNGLSGCRWAWRRALKSTGPTGRSRAGRSACGGAGT